MQRKTSMYVARELKVCQIVISGSIICDVSQSTECGKRAENFTQAVFVLAFQIYETSFSQKSVYATFANVKPQCLS